MSGNVGKQEQVRKDWATSEFDRPSPALNCPGMGAKNSTLAITPLTECVQVAVELNTHLGLDLRHLSDVLWRVTGVVFLDATASGPDDVSHLQPVDSTIGELQRALMSINDRAGELGRAVSLLEAKMG